MGERREGGQVPPHKKKIMLNVKQMDKGKLVPHNKASAPLPLTGEILATCMPLYSLMFHTCNAYRIIFSTYTLWET